MIARQGLGKIRDKWERVKELGGDDRERSAKITDQPVT